MRYKTLLACIALVAIIVFAGCGPKNVHVAVSADTALVNALHLVRVNETAAFASGLYPQTKHDTYLKVILQSDQDALALTDAIDQWRLAGGDPATVPAIVARTKTALQAVLADLASLPPNNAFVSALKFVIGLLS